MHCNINTKSDYWRQTHVTTFGGEGQTSLHLSPPRVPKILVTPLPRESINSIHKYGMLEHSVTGLPLPGGWVCKLISFLKQAKTQPIDDLNLCPIMLQEKAVAGLLCLILDVYILSSYLRGCI